MFSHKQSKKKLSRPRAEAIVKGHGWLSATAPEFQKLFLARCDLLQLAPGQNVYEVGDAAGGIFGVAEGRIELHLPTHGLEPTLAYIGGPGFWVGDAAAVRGHTRMLSVVAGTKCSIFRLPRVELVRLTGESPATWPNVAAMLAANMRRTIYVIDALKRSSPVARVAAMLVNLMDDISESANIIDVSQEDLANLTHLKRGAVNAALKELEAKRLILRQYGSIKITRPTALLRYADQ